MGYGVQTDNQEKIPMTDRDGKKYVCALSNPRVQHSGKTGDVHNGSSIGLVTDERSTRKSPEELLEELKDLCFRRVTIKSYLLRDLLAAYLRQKKGPTTFFLWWSMTCQNTHVKPTQLKLRDSDRFNELKKEDVPRGHEVHRMYCLIQDEGWWSYVLCFKGDVRQFHADTSTGNKKVDLEYSFSFHDNEKRLKLFFISFCKWLF